MWPLRVYTRKKRAGERLNLTPTPDLSVPAKAKAPLGPGRKGKRNAHGLPKVSEKAEQSEPGGSGSGPLRVTGEKSLKNSTSEETLDEKHAPLNESVTDNLQGDSCSSNSELVSGLSLQDDISSSLQSDSITDSYTECNSYEESLSTFSSPELLRGPDYLDWECLKLEEHVQCRNSTLLDSSKAVAIEKASQFSNLSAILGPSSEDYQKCHRKMVMTLADYNLFPEPKSTPSLESDNAASELALGKKTCSPAPEKTKKKEKNPTIPGKKSRGLLTSTPSSKTSGFVIDLSSVQKASFEEELFPNVSNYVNSNEIVPVSSLPEDSSNQIPSNISEICCIIRASPGTRQVKIKGVTVKKKYSPCKDIPQGIII
ncbi:meiosis-specific kinetochore protein [Orycteropus afer afer]|uniref:Meiosis-specific kinetochore protein n=1 Tax=Orycteropus afer afer TaxID=1230840 RepID=A0AC54Z8R1_ORYAF|nr:meiosis-specific kinetochore protein [Orycteropus afer afer]